MTTEIFDNAAAIAAAQQVPVERSIEAVAGGQCAPVLLHPAARVHDSVAQLLLPCLDTLAAAKRVSIAPEHCLAVVELALRYVPIAIQQRVMRADQNAVTSACLALNHALDVIAVSRLIALWREGSKLAALSDAEIVRQAEASLRARSANDGPVTAIVWSDLAEISAGAANAHHRFTRLRGSQTVIGGMSLRSDAANTDVAEAADG